MRRLRTNVNNTWMLMILSALVVGCSSGVPLVPETDCLPPDWVVSPPSLDQYYWGTGSEALGERSSARSRAYEEAVGNLALMAGQTISASFEEYQSFQGSDRKSVLESKIFHEVRTLARHELRGVTIRDFWTDACEKEYHVLVVVGRAEANQQISENARKQADQEIREAILLGISNLEGRVSTLESEVDDLQNRTGEIEQRYGGLLVRLARLEKAVARERKPEGPGGRETVNLAGQVEEIKQDMARKVPSEVVARKIQAAEWFEKALVLYDRATEQGEPSREALDEVIRLNALSIKLNPRSSGAYNNRGAAYAKQGDHESSLRDFTRALELDSHDATAYSNRGAAYGRLGDYDRALQDLTKALELDPHDSATYSNRGIVFRIKGEYDRSIRDYTRALELDPQNAVAFNNRGVTWMAKLEYERAIEDFTWALEIAPGYAEGYNNRGRALLETGRLDRAFPDFSRAIEIRPGYGLAYYNRGEAFLRQGRKEHALKDLLRSCELGFEPACTVSRNIMRDGSS